MRQDALHPLPDGKAGERHHRLNQFGTGIFPRQRLAHHRRESGVDLAQATRSSPSVQLGVSPRAATALLAASKAWAWLGAYPAITPDHVQTMLVPTWRHRIRLRPDAELEGVSVDAVLGSVLQQTRVPI